MSGFDVVMPSTGERLRHVDGHTPEQVQHILSQTEAAARAWAKTRFAERAAVLRAAAELLEDEADSLAVLMAEEMGKPVSQGVSEAKKCAWVCRYYAEHAEEQLRSEPIEADFSRSYVAYRPIGAVLAVMPWNYPLWQVFRFAAPALMAGNVGLLKHASNVPGCALAIEDILHRAGLPPAAFRTLLIGSDQVPAVLDHPIVRAATLTGSVGAGRAVAKACGERLMKTVLELGGSDAYLVLDDADLDHAAEVGATSRLLNSGQSCIAAKRFIVVDAVYDAFCDKLRERLAARVMGDPFDSDTQIGPQAREDLRDELHDQVQRSIAAGARCVLGGEVPERAGAWYPATLLVDVDADNPANREELFGPVAAVVRARDEAHAIELANDSVFGLGGAVFTEDDERGRLIAEEQLDAGCCFVNDFVKSDPRLPFGGVKDSGYGRELGRFGIREFVNIKTVAVR